MIDIDIEFKFRSYIGKLLFIIHYFTRINFPVGWILKCEVRK